MLSNVMTKPIAFYQISPIQEHNNQSTNEYGYNSEAGYEIWLTTDDSGIVRRTELIGDFDKTYWDFDNEPKDWLETTFLYIFGMTSLYAFNADSSWNEGFGVWTTIPYPPSKPLDGETFIATVSQDDDGLFHFLIEEK